MLYRSLGLLLTTLFVVQIAGPTIANDPLTATSNIVDLTLPSGLHIVCEHDTSSPLVSIQAYVKAGASQEPADEPGIGNYVARMLTEGGLTDESPEILTGDINNLGGNVTTSWHQDYAQVSALVLGEQFDDAAFLVTNLLKKAAFDPSAIEEVRSSLLDSIDQTNSSVFSVAYQGALGGLYTGTNYLIPPSGTLASVSHIRRDDLIRYYRHWYVPQNLVIVVVGNVDPQSAAAKLADDSSDFSDYGHVPIRPLNSPAALGPMIADKPITLQSESDLDELCMVIGYRIPPISSEDYPALMIANAMLGGMKSSLLFTEIREKQGLSYELGSLVTTHVIGGDLSAFVVASPLREDPVTKRSVSAIPFLEEQILKQVLDLKANLVPTTDINRAKHFLIGSDKIRHERLEDRADLLGQSILLSPFGIKWDTKFAQYISAVTPGDVQRVAGKYLVHPVVSVLQPEPSEKSISNE